MSTTSSSEIEMHHRTRNPTGHSMTSLQKISLAITGSMEKFFYRWGFLVATYPKTAIFSCFFLTAICGLGLFNFQMENRPDRLWIPRQSEFAENADWLRKNFPSPIRTSWTLITAENVLVPEVMRVIIGIHEKVKEIEVKEGKRWDDICFKLPITKFLSRRKRSLDPILDYNSSQVDKNAQLEFFSNTMDHFDDSFSDDFFTQDVFSSRPNTSSSSQNVGIEQFFSVPDEFYCSLMKELEAACWEISPAELWSFNRTHIDNLTREEIIRVINHELISPIFGRSVNYTVELGGDIVKNDKGEVISAQSVFLRWAVGINQTVMEGKEEITDGTGEIADEYCLEWEQKWTLLMKNISATLPPGINAYFFNSQSWTEISEATLLEDGMVLAVGFLIMFLYVGTMLGKFNVVEQRPFLTMAGLSCVGLACIVSYGICSLFNIVYGPVNKILPFLLLGIGIDDMFVIMQCWNNLFPSPLTEKSKFSIPERMGMAMKHAGVSITVTSLTDIAAFAVGASTILPGLQSFCIYAAVGIVAIFIFQATYFVAWFALDQKRVEDRRNAFFFWIKYTEADFIPNSWSQESYAQFFFDKVLSKYLFKTWVKVLVILITGGFLGVTIYGNTQLRQEFDPIWFLPEDSYMTQYVQKRDHFYKGTGYPAFFVANKVNWSESIEAFGKLVNDLKDSDTLYQLDDWYEEFKDYSNTHFDTDIPNRALSPSKFQKYMGKFLYSPIGSKFKPYFKIDGNFTCGDDLPPVETVVMPFRFKKFNGPEEHIPGMHLVKSLLRTSNISFTMSGKMSKLFAWGPGLVAWETDEIINAELYRNVALSLLCVLITTFLLLANLRVCVLCGICVVFTLTNVGGFMHFWGLTIDTVSCIDIVLGIGLCVDYAAHIALAFMTCTGSKESRAKQALKNIGPAVLNGGFSTFLAIMLLANSNSYAFQTFFKIFFVVIIFGLFHGLIFLPVILSMFGPEPYLFAYSREDDFETYKHKGITSSPLKIVEMKPLQHDKSANFSKDFIYDIDSKNVFSTSDPLLAGQHSFENETERTQQ